MLSHYVVKFSPVFTALHCQFLGSVGLMIQSALKLAVVISLMVMA